jgi:hypothetical protein
LRIRDFGVEVTAALLPYEGDMQNIENMLFACQSFDEAKDWFCKQKRGKKNFYIEPSEKEVEEGNIAPQLKKQTSRAERAVCNES